MNPEDPLVQALPPATDYLTYLTLLEYQLTPKRLPLLHQLLQDERLTTNIGWDLVKLLLPMLPASTECLQDVARLGNPREVILRVSEALMQLQSEGDDEDDDDADGSLPKHILQFNCLLSMLSVLHGRIKTKSPSRFIATSLQAALEAYTAMPCDETTLALLEFLRDVSPSKRPAPPPRAPSESSVLRTAKASAPDPEAEVALPSPSATNETLLVRKFIQFGLVELLKSYLLSFSSPMDPGMSWTIRMQEHLHPSLRLPEQSQTQAYSSTKELKERDMLLGKIVALSRDVGIDSTELLSIVSRSPDEHLPPLDFEEPPTSPDEIPLERHGSLLLLAARAAGSTLFTSGNLMPPLSVFPDIAAIFTNFLGASENVDEVAYGEPQALLDSLLALTVHAMQNPIVTPSNETEFKDFVTALTACTARQTHGIVRQIPTAIVHSHPSSSTRFKLIRSILEEKELTSVRDSAVTWLREEIIGHVHESAETVFHDPLHFWILFQSLFTSVKTASSANILDSWTRLTQTEGPGLHSALNLYYLLLSSPSLRDTLQLEKTVVFFRGQVLEPLHHLFRAFESDLTAKGGDGIIESAVGKEMCQVGNARSAGLVGLTLDQIEEAIHDAYGTDDSDLKAFTQEEETRVAEIRKETEGWK
ncbi:Zinc finger DHHC-type palmitoyltransferase [Penicillium atrosanguineum]|uniref:Zinc finger DHHC-type palmitoyltransferase n=1 Tax=Penicillium atrosanguineum TaxID=1132637 RepID=UPI002388B6C4|nr:Zinc finger DHHC-type palmitoyltransferase [Penicillium atrosanguineum]KAJ5310008.1 Zinc finger DHHC-type palmitoyltransferase [Penicillium atrosanguineum]